MGLLRCTSAPVLAARGFAVVAHAQTGKASPTDDEIQLVLTQTEPALQPYKPLTGREEVQMGRSYTDAADNDRQVARSLEMAVKAFEGKPQGFHGPLGLALFEWLDDAGRNALLGGCGASSQAHCRGWLEIKTARNPCFTSL